METVWIRLGGVVTADKRTMKKILEGDTDALVKTIKKNGFRLNGETYIPAQGNIESDIDFDFVPDETLIVKTNNKKPEKTSDSSKIYNKEDFEFVDLGLPSGTLWAKSSAPGFYTFDESKEQFPGILPEADQFQELFDKCNWQWLEKEDTPNGVAGYRVSGPNGNSIFLEANGYQPSKAVEYYVGRRYGYYWSATAYNTPCGCHLKFKSGGVYPRNYNFRYYGYNVRPAVKPKYPAR